MCATGRGLPNTKAIWSEVFPNSPAVLANGAEVWLDCNTLLERFYMPTDAVLKLYELAQAAGGSYWAYSTNGLVQNIDLQTHDPGEGWYKFGIFHPDRNTITQLWNIAAALDGVLVTSSHPSNIEVSAEGVSKRSGLERLCTELGIQLSEVMAIGDSHNDLDMLRAVGLGVAMGNGSDEVKEAADEITKTNAEDGVALAIQKYLL